LDALPIGQPWLTVLDDSRQVQGIIAVSDVVRGYRTAVRADARRLSAISANSTISELRVSAQSPLVGRTIAAAGLPEGTVVISILRADGVLFGTGSLQLQADDVLTVLARPDRAEQLRMMLEPIN
ncbi:MAG: TrkA C-terminal domain-containing protein, partial [Jatrophihabitantaceae bacterium]